MEKSATPRQKGGRKVDAVLEGATRVFLERGYAAASMNDVAAAATVSKRTLYQYFTSKEALFAAFDQKGVVKTDFPEDVRFDVLHFAGPGLTHDESPVCLPRQRASASFDR